MRSLMILTAVGGLSACHSAPPVEDAFTSVIEPITVTREAGIDVGGSLGPPDADPDSCYAHELTPAVLETVTEEVIVEPEERDAGGTLTRAAIFASETEQRIVEDRQEIWFETPCGIDGNTDYIATLQRALAARGHYIDEITGIVNPATTEAIRAYQQPQGLDSGVLSLAAARQLGLAIWDPDLAAGALPPDAG